MPPAAEEGEVVVTARVDWAATFARFSALADSIRSRTQMLSEQLPTVEATARLYVPSGAPFVDYFRRTFCQGEGVRRTESFRLIVTGPGGNEHGSLVNHIRKRVADALIRAPCRRFRLRVAEPFAAKTQDAPAIRVSLAKPVNGHLPAAVTVGASASQVPPERLRLFDARSLCLASCSVGSWPDASRHCDRVAELKGTEPSAYCLIESHVYQRKYARAETIAERFHRSAAVRDPKLVAWYGIIKMHTGAPDAWVLLDQVRDSEVVRDHALYWLNLASADLIRARGDKGRSTHRRNACRAFARYLELKPGAPEHLKNLMREQGCIVGN